MSKFMVYDRYHNNIVSRHKYRRTAAAAATNYAFKHDLCDKEVEVLKVVATTRSHTVYDTK